MVLQKNKNFKRNTSVGKVSFWFKKNRWMKRLLQLPSSTDTAESKIADDIEFFPLERSEQRAISTPTRKSDFSSSPENGSQSSRTIDRATVSRAKGLAPLSDIGRPNTQTTTTKIVPAASHAARINQAPAHHEADSSSFPALANTSSPPYKSSTCGACSVCRGKNKDVSCLLRCNVRERDDLQGLLLTDEVGVAL